QRETHVGLFLDNLDAYFEVARTRSIKEETSPATRPWWSLWKGGEKSDSAHDDNEPRLALPSPATGSVRADEVDQDVADFGQDERYSLQGFVYQIIEFLPESLEERLRSLV